MEIINKIYIKGYETDIVADYFLNKGCVDFVSSNPYNNAYFRWIESSDKEDYVNF